MILCMKKACLPKYITTHTRQLLHVQIILSELYLCQHMQMTYEAAEAKASTPVAVQRKFLEPEILRIGG